MRVCGDYTYIGGNFKVEWGDRSGLYVGKFCSIGANVMVYLGGNHNVDWVTTYPFGHIHQDIFHHSGIGHPSTKGDVIIGNDVWIANNVTIMSGITIGDGAIIANNSHVVKNVEPYSIVGGNPARLIKLRFTPDQISALLRIKWWDWDIQRINSNIPLLCSPNIQDFIDANPCSPTSNHR